MTRRARRFGLRKSAIPAVGMLLAAMIVLAPDVGAAAPSVLTKSAQNLTHPGANPVNHGDTLNWVVDYANTAGGPSTITDPIPGAGSAQTYVPGSLKVPPGWTPAWSQDGTLFQPNDPGAATVSVRATNQNARPGGTTLTGTLLPPVQAAATATGGDGYTPILHRKASGSVESWNMFHHAGAASAKLVCVDLSAGSLCAGGPWPKPVNTTPGPFGSGNTGDIASAFIEQYVQDPGRPGVVYYGGTTASGTGVGCLDLEQRENCGFFPLATNAVTNIGGLVASGGNVYGVGSTGQVLCLTMATRTPCAGQPYAAVAPGNGQGSANYVGSLTVANDKIFVSSSPSGQAPVLGCFDPATTTACVFWGTPRPIGPASGYISYSAYTAYNTTGNAVGACGTAIGAVPTGFCYALDGTSLTPPSVFSSLLSGELVFNPETVTTADGHVRSYFGSWGRTLGSTSCYDWTTAAACAGFPTPAGHPGVNGGTTRDYGYAYDTTTQCLIGLGDAGVLFSEDPMTGASPCIHSGVTIDLNPSAFYCDGGTGHVQGYQNAKLENIDLANVNLAASAVKVTDAGGTVATPAIAPDGTIDLSGISYAAHPSISISVSLVLNNGSDFTPANHPSATVTYRGDAPQVCFQTTVAAACTATGVTNTATGGDAGGAITSNTVSFPVSPGEGCLPKVTVNKEICASHHAADCGPGGAGPWVKQAPVGILGLLLAHPYWRITVTNEGPIGITAAKVNDAAQPSCATAAGTFSLAPGTAKQVYCSSSVLLVLLPLTNTASATYTPTGSTPVTTAGSSATACNLLCILGG
ncbi:DUF7617 domain-containing protein [Amycolatopsis xylanica]|nr:hypothetical protein [Amycolatopsis xylanica]